MAIVHYQIIIYLLGNSHNIISMRKRAFFFPLSKKKKKNYFLATSCTGILLYDPQYDSICCRKPIKFKSHIEIIGFFL